VRLTSHPVALGRGVFVFRRVGESRSTRPGDRTGPSAPSDPSVAWEIELAHHVDRGRRSDAHPRRAAQDTPLEARSQARAHGVDAKHELVLLGALAPARVAVTLRVEQRRPNRGLADRGPADDLGQNVTTSNPKGVSGRGALRCANRFTPIDSPSDGRSPRAFDHEDPHRFNAR